jgi:hypothetical protein
VRALWHSVARARAAQWQSEIMARAGALRWQDHLRWQDLWCHSGSPGRPLPPRLSGSRRSASCRPGPCPSGPPGDGPPAGTQRVCVTARSAVFISEVARVAGCPGPGLCQWARQDLDRTRPWTACQTLAGQLRQVCHSERSLLDEPKSRPSTSTRTSATRTHTVVDTRRKVTLATTSEVTPSRCVPSA